MVQKATISKLAKVGLCAKGTIYVLLGFITALAAFHLAGASGAATDQNGVIRFLREQTGGKILLVVLALGLACYVIWRFVQAFADTEHKGFDKKGVAIRVRYFISGLAYGSLAYQVVRMLTSGSKGSGNGSRSFVAELLGTDYGQWLVGSAALIIAAIGIYQIYYGLSEKYRKHVDGAGRHKALLLKAGKFGYFSRGVVWLLIAWLFLKAAFSSNSNAAGGTSKAFTMLEGTEYGSYVLGAIGLGLVCYGAFNFIRARFEQI